MHLDNLKIFTDLVEGESFSQAARLNDVTQSAVSQQLRMLERELEVFLIDRSQKQFRLTREGKKFYDFSHEILQRHRQLKNELLSLQQVLTGSVCVSTIYSIGLHHLPAYLKRFLQQHPSVDVHVQYRRSGQVYDDVLRQGQDLGLVAFPEKHRGLEIIPLRDDPMVLVVEPSHPFATQSGVSLRDLAGQAFIAFVDGLPTRRAVDDLLERAGVEVKITMEFDNIETVKSAAEIGAGVTFVPEGTVRNEVEKGTLKVIPLSEPTLCRSLAVIHRKDRPLSPAAEAFVELLKAISL